jgi:hypothetical protein
MGKNGLGDVAHSKFWLYFKVQLLIVGSFSSSLTPKASVWMGKERQQKDLYNQECDALFLQTVATQT